MALFDKLRTDGTLSLRGLQGPQFENEGQRTTSDIQALVDQNSLIGSQDMVSGRSYNRIRTEPSDLDMGGVTPDQYVNRVGLNPTSPTYVSTGMARSTLLGMLSLSRYGLGGLPGPTFENESQRTTSNIQALATNNSLISSQDMVNGRFYGTGRFTVYQSPSVLDMNGTIIGGSYRDNGPRDGRY
jgi:hypothetical protein